MLFLSLQVFQMRQEKVLVGLVAESCPILITLWLLCPWTSPSKNAGVGCHFFLLRDQTQVSCIAGGFFKYWATRERFGVKWIDNINILRDGEGGLRWENSE